MAAVRTSLTGSWVKLADAGSFFIQNSGAIPIEIAVTDTPPTSSANSFFIDAYGHLPMLAYEQDLYGRGPGAVTLLSDVA